MYFAPYDASAERLTKAKVAVDHALRLKPDLPEAHLAFGFYYYWGLMNYEKAIDEFSIAKNTMPNNPLIVVGLASIHKRQGNFHEALQKNREALELDPRNSAAALEMGIIHNTIGKHSEAQHYFDLAISLAPDALGAYAYKVNNYLEWTGDTKGARAIITKIPDENARNEHLTSIEVLDRNYQKALDLLNSRSEKSYRDAILAGNCHRLMNDKVKARASYEMARDELEGLLQKGSEKAELHSRISIAYAGLNQKEEAIREARTAIQMLPVSKDAVTGRVMVRNLARVYVMLGEYDDAMDQIDHLLSSGMGVGPFSAPMLRIDPIWDPLRSHSRFQELLEKYNRSSNKLSYVRKMFFSIIFASLLEIT
jgi:tetratricopeptide (TPR) repeat protein